MGRTAKEIIEEKLAIQAKKEKDKKLEFLKKLGLVHREYAAENAQRSAEYPIFDLNTRRYYALVADPISDEEYLQLRSLEDQVPDLTPPSETEPTDHGIGTLLVVSAVLVYLIGLIFGIVSISNRIFGSWLLIWVGAFIGGSFLLGMSEIIRLLKNKL